MYIPHMCEICGHKSLFIRSFAYLADFSEVIYVSGANYNDERLLPHQYLAVN